MRSSDAGHDATQHQKIVPAIAPLAPSNDEGRDVSSEPAVPVNNPTVPSSDGKQSPEQRRKSFPVHGDRGKCKMSVRLSIGGGSIPEEDDEHSIP